jgi:hypothetical protein
MATFKDKTGQDWSVNLDPVIADEIKQDHQIQIVNLETDPMLKLRTDPSILCAVMLVICRDQIAAQSLTREQFLKRLPFPPDAMLAAIEESIVNFFPTGRASHVRDVLTSYGNMGGKTDELTTAKMRSLSEDPRLKKALSDKVDIAIAQAMQSLIDSPVGT